EPTGYVNTFAVRFYPYGFANFVSTPIINLVNKETPIEALFGTEPARALEESIIQAAGTDNRIKIIEDFLRSMLEAKPTVDSIVKSTIDALLATRGSTSIKAIINTDLSKRR